MLLYLHYTVCFPGRPHSSSLRSQEWPWAGGGDAAGQRSPNSVKDQGKLVCSASFSFILPFVSLQIFCILSVFPPERSVSSSHGDAGRPSQLRPAAAAPRGAGGRRDQRLPDGIACGRPLRTLQGGESHRGQKGQPQRQSTGEDCRDATWSIKINRRRSRRKGDKLFISGTIKLFFISSVTHV